MNLDVFQINTIKVFIEYLASKQKLLFSNERNLLSADFSPGQYQLKLLNAVLENLQFNSLII